MTPISAKTTSISTSVTPASGHRSVGNNGFAMRDVGVYPLAADLSVGAERHEVVARAAAPGET